MSESNLKNLICFLLWFIPTLLWFEISIRTGEALFGVEQNGKIVIQNWRAVAFILYILGNLRAYGLWADKALRDMGCRS